MRFWEWEGRDWEWRDWEWREVTVGVERLRLVERFNVFKEEVMDADMDADPFIDADPLIPLIDELMFTAFAALALSESDLLLSSRACPS